MTDCPYCEMRTFRTWQEDPDNRRGQCDNCGFTGYCDQCGVEIEDPHLRDDARHCSEECAWRTEMERRADQALAERKR